MSLQKSQVIIAIRSALAESLDAVERTAAMARDETTSGETRTEGKYDTRATEASYLARGQAWRIAELRQLQAWFEHLSEETVAAKAGIGALVHLDGDQNETVFVAPVGGTRVEVNHTPVRVISLASPLGQALEGLEEGDCLSVETPRGTLELEVISVG